MKQAFPGTPMSFHLALEQTCKEIEEMSIQKKHIRRTTVLAATLAATLLLATIAYAATQSGLLRRLFPDSAPSEQAVRLETPIDLTGTDAGFRFTLNDYLLDGSDLYVDWTAESTAGEPVLLLSAPILTTLDDEKMMDVYDPASLSFYEGVLLEGAHKAHDAYRRAHYYGDAITEEQPFDVTLSALFMKPIAPMRPYDELGDFTKTPTFEVNERNGDGVRYLTLMDSHHPDADLIEIGPDLMYTALEERRQSQPNLSITDRYQQVIEQLGFAQTIGRIDLTFTIDPSGKPIEYTAIDGQNAFVFDEFKIEFTKADFNAASTQINYILTPTDKMPGKLDASSGFTDYSLSFKVLPDGKGTPVRFSQMLETFGEGERYYGEIWGDPLSEIPRSVTFIPYTYAFVGPDPETAIFTETPVSDIRFTLNLAVTGQ